MQYTIYPEDLGFMFFPHAVTLNGALLSLRGRVGVVRSAANSRVSPVNVRFQSNLGER